MFAFLGLPQVLFLFLLFFLSWPNVGCVRLSGRSSRLVGSGLYDSESLSLGICFTPSKDTLSSLEELGSRRRDPNQRRFFCFLFFESMQKRATMVLEWYQRDRLFGRTTFVKKNKHRVNGEVMLGGGRYEW